MSSTSSSSSSKLSLVGWFLICCCCCLGVCTAAEISSDRQNTEGDETDLSLLSNSNSNSNSSSGSGRNPPGLLLRFGENQTATLEDTAALQSVTLGETPEAAAAPAAPAATAAAAPATVEAAAAADESEEETDDMEFEDSVAAEEAAEEAMFRGFARTQKAAKRTKGGAAAAAITAAATAFGSRPAGEESASSVVGGYGEIYTSQSIDTQYHNFYTSTPRPADYVDAGSSFENTILLLNLVSDYFAWLRRKKVFEPKTSTDERASEAEENEGEGGDAEETAETPSKKNTLLKVAAGLTALLLLVSLLAATGYALSRKRRREFRSMDRRFSSVSLDSSLMQTATTNQQQNALIEPVFAFHEQANL